MDIVWYSDMKASHKEALNPPQTLVAVSMTVPSTLCYSAAVEVFRGLIQGVGTPVPPGGTENPVGLRAGSQKRQYTSCANGIRPKPQENNLFWEPPGPVSLCITDLLKLETTRHLFASSLTSIFFFCLFGWVIDQRHQMWPEKCHQSPAARV